MGRLFWKFFFFFWLAQFVTAVCVGLAIWSFGPEHRRPPHRAPPERMLAPRPPPPHGEPHPGHFLPPPPVLIAGSLVSLLFAALLAGYVARPIRSLHSAFEAVAGGRLETRIGASMGRRNDELSDLGSDFDRMTERLQSLLETQRRLLHDVSHELRSPLARLQAAADLMRQQPERGAEFIERIERDTARMDKLIGELLTLARLDAGMTGQLDADVDLGEIIADIAGDAQLEAETKACAIKIELHEPLITCGSHELLYRALENVVRNAVRHTPASSTLVISARTTAGRLHVSVADQGSGVPDADLAAIFDPFFRSGAGRPDGYGLGLAITRRITEAHGGRVCATNQANGGLLVTLEFPARPV